MGGGRRAHTGWYLKGGPARCRLGTCPITARSDPVNPAPRPLSEALATHAHHREQTRPSRSRLQQREALTMRVARGPLARTQRGGSSRARAPRAAANRDFRIPSCPPLQGASGAAMRPSPSFVAEGRVVPCFCPSSLGADVHRPARPSRVQNAHGSSSMPGLRGPGGRGHGRGLHVLRDALLQVHSAQPGACAPRPQPAS